ncbi:family 43 glycosylhydrolase [Spirillospora sp. CA-294931]|uniref:family 43 glycosylhydrolase n=1 Tax=Spirillospora sp. CA-294931 TaxID=3240042 RepID=UPI003D8D6F39
MRDRPLAVVGAGALVTALVAAVIALLGSGDGTPVVRPPVAAATSGAPAPPGPQQRPMDSAPSKQAPVLDSNFPDPEILKVDGTYYGYATNDGGKNVPIATAPRPAGPWTRTGADALPALPAWAEPGRTWAPDISRRADGTYVLYFTAGRKGTADQCVGAASAPTPTGPFTPVATPMVCRDGKDTIDPAAFVDTDGTRYVLFKQEGSGRRDPGGLFVQRADADGLRLEGAPTRILTRGADEPTLVEAPALVKQGGRYVLFYAAGVFYRTDYQTRYATAPAITGPYTKAGGPLLSTDGYGKEITGPGGADVVHDGSDAYLVFHGITKFSGGDAVLRAMYVAELGWANGAPVVRGSRTRYEAERGRVFGAQIRKGVPAASGGSVVGYLDNAQCLVDLDVFAPGAGDYVLRVRYANRATGPAEHALTVNGGAAQAVRYPAEPKDQWRDSTVEVSLRPGWNVLRFSYQSGHAEFDYAELS